MSGAEDVTAIAVRGEQLAWTVDDSDDAADNGVWLASLKGEGPKQVTASPTYPKSVVLEATQILWADSEGVWSITTSGGTPIHLSFGSARSLVVDDKRLYWSDAGTVRTIDRGQTEAQGESLEVFGDELAIGGGYLYAAGKKAVTRLKLDDAAAKPETVVDQRTQLAAITLDGDTLYLIDRVGGTGGDLLSVPAAGGTAKTLASGLQLGAYTTIVVAGGQAYLPGLSALLQVPTSGGSVRERYCTGGNAAVGDASRVYWAADIQGGIWTGKL
ncbi:MAG: hypothetical protein EOO75_20795 [Myxococcales bacterium]|nr:MAG: hypothetical protein EOO75_20795 [Myxococcales bacterium]